MGGCFLWDCTIDSLKARSLRPKQQAEQFLIPLSERSAADVHVWHGHRSPDLFDFAITAW
jgi:hypothetical protein